LLFVSDFRYSDFRLSFAGGPSTLLLRTSLARENLLNWFCQHLERNKVTAIQKGKKMATTNAEKIFRGGPIVTMDDARRQVEAVAIAGGKIIAGISGCWQRHS
jgi:hypothetical protein